MKKLVYTTILLFAMFISVYVESNMAAAANGTVKIYIGDGETARHHMSIVLGNTSDEYRFEVKGYEVKSSTYTSSNPSAFTIKKTGEGTCKVETIAEGSGYVTLTVKTADNEILTEKIFISVYDRITQCDGKASKEVNVYRGASSNAGVENEDKKGVIAKDEEITIIATCEDYYFFRNKSGEEYIDGYDSGFVKKSDVNVLVGNVSLQEKHVSMEISQSKTLVATITPSIATNKNLSWSGNDDKVVSVSSTGKVSGVAEGVVMVTATAKDGTKKKGTATVSVYKKIDEVSGYINVDTPLYADGNNKVSVGEGTSKTKVILIGSCGNYYRAKVDGTYCYILKSKVTIPVTGIKLDKEKVTLLAGNKVQLKEKVLPNLADNKNVKWSTSNKKVATVTDKGYVTAKKAGKVTITATTIDGGKSAKCEITVVEKKNANKVVQEKPLLEVTPSGIEDIKLKVYSGREYNGFVIYLNGKKYTKYQFGAGKGEIVYYLKGLKVNKNYKVQVRTFLKKNQKVLYYRKSEEKKIKVGNVTVTARLTDNKEITLQWTKLKKIEKYYIYRSSTKFGKYKRIGKVKKSKKTYIDKNLKLNKVYYYKVCPVGKKNVLGTSNIAYATVIKLKNAGKYIIKKYPTVCMDKNIAMNKYNINGVYSPVKYRFVDNELQIHVYLEFVTYSDTGKVDNNKIRIFKKREASVVSEISTEKYISMFKEGIREAYAIDVVGGKGDFKKGVNFSTKLYIHDKKSKANYHENQKFVEILIGGECPNCTSKGDHWYHINENNNAPEYKEYEDVCVIYMPTIEQVRANTEPGYNIPSVDYGETAAHEIGHLLGMNDAYPVKGVDRCADNNETGYEYDDGKYDNLMKGHTYYKTINTNGVEMILRAIENRTGMPKSTSQSFKTHDECVISDVIYNRKDYQKDN